MKRLKERMAGWIASLLLSGLVLTPVLAALRLLAPGAIPGWTVLVPLAGGLHLALCWMAAQAIAFLLLMLAAPPGK